MMDFQLVSHVSNRLMTCVFGSFEAESGPNHTLRATP